MRLSDTEMGGCVVRVKDLEESGCLAEQLTDCIASWALCCAASSELSQIADVDRNHRRRVMSEEDQRYIATLLDKYGENFKVRGRALSVR